MTRQSPEFRELQGVITGLGLAGNLLLDGAGEFFKHHDQEKAELLRYWGDAMKMRAREKFDEANKLLDKEPGEQSDGRPMTIQDQNDAMARDVAEKVG